MRKNWFTLFNVEVTARANIVKKKKKKEKKERDYFSVSAKLLVRLQPNLI